MIGYYNDGKIRLFNENGTNIMYEMDVSPIIITSIYLNKQMEVMLCGTSTGALRVYLWPFTNYMLK